MSHTEKAPGKYLEAKTKALLKSFLSRDYSSDIKRLNVLLERHLGRSAGFVEAQPPLPFAGDPFNPSLAGNCIALFGLNPRWRADDTFYREREYRPLKLCVDGIRTGERTVEEFLALRRSYFSLDNEFYYGRYYTKLGGLLGQRWFPEYRDTARTPREFAVAVFQNHVFKADILPWFSSDTNGIDASKLGKDDEALKQFHDLIACFITMIRPRWIQFNGLQGRELIEATFKSKLDEYSTNINGKSHRYLFGWCDDHRIVPTPTPLFVHGFTNSAGGPQSPQQFNAIAFAFQEWVNDHSRFSFELQKSKSQ